LDPSRVASSSGAATVSAFQQPTGQRHWDRFQGNWKQVTGKAKEQWGKLTDDDFDVVGGRRDQLAGKIQERYGVAKDEAEKQVAEWQRKATDSWFTK
jgi:uncharacterized protein YjbJ (UPF0337 family)